MRQFLCAILAVTACLCANAEGYQVNTLSARQGGMGHTGVAQHLGAESVYFNPAGLGFMTSTFDLSGSFNAVLATAKATIDGKTYETDNDASTPLMVNAAFSIYDNFKAGVGIFTPYGSGINWGRSWPGANLNQSVTLRAFTIQPTFAWMPIKGLSIGAGLNISWGNVNLDKGLINAGTMDTMVGLLKASGQLPADTQTFNGTTPASVNLRGDSGVGLGFTVGAMWDINPQWTVGAMFRSEQKLRVKAGLASVEYANNLAQNLLESQLGMIDRANFSAEMPMPYVLTFGASYRPLTKLLVAFDAQLTGWSAYKSLDVTFLDPNISKFDQHLTKDYKDAWAFRLGAEYALTKRFDVRAGLILDLSPVNKQHYNPETPGMTKVEPSLGLSFRPIKNLSIDLSMLYVAGLGVDGASCSYPDLLAPSVNAAITAAGLPMEQLPTVQTVKGDYKVHAFVPSIGLTFTL